jgi:hypothetical protein
MKPFKFLRENEKLHSSPIKDAVVNAINICNRTDIRYEYYNYYFMNGDNYLKLKVFDIRRYRNPVFSYFIIRYKIGESNCNMDYVMVFNQLRLDEEEYYRLIHETP